MDKTWSLLLYNLRWEIKLDIIQGADPKDGWSVDNTGMLNMETAGLLHSSMP